MSHPCFLSSSLYMGLDVKNYERTEERSITSSQTGPQFFGLHQESQMTESSAGKLPTIREKFFGGGGKEERQERGG